ncbi:MAG: type II secretion system protein [Planctomycetota bacterium]|nr:type II secretion system protein [Planctomycetota bacterium]
MNTCLNVNDRSDRRGGFTVVEILIAITVIAILSAMLIPVVGSAMRRANEFAIESEMAQLDLAIEHFKSDNGFYPPSFTRLSGGADLMPYLNRIAPNHGYSVADLNQWWTSVGSVIQGSAGADLVFWLSGISKNKQYPLSDVNSGAWLAPHAYGPDAAQERNVYYEFAADRLNFGNNNSGAANYLQAKGKQADRQGNPAVYQYLDSGSYGIVRGGYCKNGATDLTDPVSFFNESSFQLFAPGLDGEVGKTPSQVGGLLVTDFLVNGQSGGLDNIVNFVGEGAGKLETKALGID